MTGRELDRRLDGLLQDRKGKGRFRQLKEYDEGQLIDFSSNDYLSLTTSPALRSAFLQRLQDAEPNSIFGSTGSRLLSGSTSHHSSLEDRFARFFDSPAALLFNSGWDANVSFFATVPQPGDWVIYDELVHASVHSGLRASRVRQEQKVAFRHNDPEDFERVCSSITTRCSGSSTGASAGARGTVFVALESLYSMDGDFAPLSALLDILDRRIPRQRQCLVLDEAHSTGVYGSQGRGVTHALGQQARVAVRLMTFGKAVGSSGAVLLCSPTVRSFLINFARPFIFSTAISHTSLIALHCAWDVIQSPEGDQRRSDLMALIKRFHLLLDPVLQRTPSHILRYPPSQLPSTSTGDPPPSPPAPIIGLLTRTPHALSAHLLQQGFIVRPVVPPTVPPGEERVRVCLRAGIDKDVVGRLVDAIQAWTEQKVRDDQQSQAAGGGQKGARSVELKAKL